MPPLLAAVHAAAPDLVVISGDFTQRARVQEFKDAASFLAKLPQPQLLVPGNHDVPLYNFMRRWLAPLDRYRRYITDNLAPFHVDDEIAVLGINTARALTFKNGRINQAQLAVIPERLATLGPQVTRIIVTHHPFEPAAPLLGRSTGHVVVGRAGVAVAAFADSKIDMILSGHLHLSRVGGTAERYPAHTRNALLIQAGTATSTRQRGEVNAFNIVRIARPDSDVTSMVWDPERRDFREGSVERFTETAAGWARRNPA